MSRPAPPATKRRRRGGGGGGGGGTAAEDEDEAWLRAAAAQPHTTVAVERATVEFFGEPRHVTRHTLYGRAAERAELADAVERRLAIEQRDSEDPYAETGGAPMPEDADAVRALRRDVRSDELRRALHANYRWRAVTPAGAAAAAAAEARAEAARVDRRASAQLVRALRAARANETLFNAAYARHVPAALLPAFLRCVEVRAVLRVLLPLAARARAGCNAHVRVRTLTRALYDAGVSTAAPAPRLERRVLQPDAAPDAVRRGAHAHVSDDAAAPPRLRMLLLHYRFACYDPEADATLAYALVVVCHALDSDDDDKAVPSDTLRGCVRSFYFAQDSRASGK